MLELRISCSRVSCNCISTSLFICSPGWFPRLTSIARDFDPLCSMEDRTAGVDAECSAASATVDFAKGNVEDGVVNSPPSRGAGRSPVCSPFPLRGCD
jgi:hypothetical protein